MKSLICLVSLLETRAPDQLTIKLLEPMPLNAVKTELDWGKLVAKIKEGEVIPIVGAGMYKFENSETGGIFSVDSYISKSLLQQCEIKVPPNALTLLETVSLIKKTTSSSYEDIEIAVDEIATELIESLKKSEIRFPLLQTLVEITGFNFFVNTTVYGGILQAIIKLADRGPLDTINFKRIGNFFSDAEKITDLKLLNIFGSCDDRTSAISEEDMLESTAVFKEKMKDSQSDLLNKLERKKILFLGCIHPDWFNRFFVRITSNKALNTWNTHQPILINDDCTSEQDKYEFFKKNKALIYEKGTDQFIQELRKHWDEKYPIKKQVFISYSHQDKAAADALYESLQKIKNVEVWIDRAFLAAGSNFPDEIASQIRDSALFIPLISNNSLHDKDSYVQDEWNLGRLVNSAKKKQNLPYFFPITISKETNLKHPLIDKNFPSSTYTIQTVLEGKPDQDFLNLFEKELDKAVQNHDN